jgi:TolA-binding protein
LTNVKADSDFANGKMDLTTVSALINQATALQTQAQTALTANNLTLASGDARAAESALRSADDLIVASIGTTGLPSAANRPARPTPTTPTTTPTADQQKARSSNELARTYKQIVDEGNTVKANSSTAAGDLSFYITTAQGLYKQAYDLYNAGKYDQASQTVRAAGSVAGIAGELLRAAGVTPTSPQVVPVPAPTF